MWRANPCTALSRSNRAILAPYMTFMTMLAAESDNTPGSSHASRISRDGTASLGLRGATGAAW